MTYWLLKLAEALDEEALVAAEDARTWRRFPVRASARLATRDALQAISRALRKVAAP